MKLILFGATGMVGGGVLREALASPDVETVLSVSRQPCGVTHPKLRELMWARVRQRVEAGLEALPFRHSGVVRPAFIRPARGIRSRTRGYQIGLVLLTPVLWLVPVLRRVFPGLFTTSEILAHAMLRVTQGRADRYILESADINRVGA